MYSSGLPAAGRLIAGVVWVLALLLAFAGAARADDCSALNGGSFSFTGPAAGANPFGAFHDGGTMFTVDAGKTLTFNVTVPANSLLRVSFGGKTLTVDNLTNGAEVMRTLSFTVSAGSGSTTGTIRFEGAVQGTETLTIAISCSGATTPGTGSSSDQMGGLMDSLVQGVVPGPGLLDVFGVPQAPDFCEGAEERLRQVRSEIIVAEGNEEGGVNLALLRTAEQFLLLCVGEEDEPEEDIADRDPCFFERQDVNEQLALVARLEEGRSGFGGLGPGFTPADDQGPLESSALDRALAALEECERLNGLAYQAVQTASTTAADALNRLASGPVYGSFGALGYQPGSQLAVSASDNRLAFAYELRQSRQRIERAFGAPALPAGLLGNPRFNLWLKGDVTFHIDATGVLQRGTTVAVAGGASYRLLPWLNAGLAGRYAHSNRFGGTGNGSADAWSVAAFAQARLARQFIFEAIVAYSGAAANATFASGATGFATGRSWAGQARLSRRFNIGTWYVSTALGLSVVNVQRDAFTASDGTAVAASNSTQTTVTFGPAFGPRQGIELGNIALKPEFGVDLFANLGKFAPLIGTGGTAVSSDTFGVTARAGLGFAFAGGATAHVKAAYAGIGGASQAVSISANLRVPIGGR